MSNYSTRMPERYIENSSQVYNDEIILEYLPYPSPIKLVIPEYCLNRRQGKVNIKKLIDYLMGDLETGLIIEYDRMFDVE